MQAKLHIKFMLSNKFRIYIALLRPNHWFKNFVVFFGSAGAIIYLNINISIIDFIIKTSVITLLACLVSSANYVMNDIADAEGDLYHPVKKNRVLPSQKIDKKPLYKLILFLLASALIPCLVIFGIKATIALLLLFIAGIVYNIQPLRLKDIPFLDVITESINNPIRILIGWFALTSSSVYPPLAYSLLFWSSGSALMSAKRYAELQFLINEHKDSKLFLYRKSFKTYTPLLLLSMVILCLLITIVLLVVLSFEFNMKLITAMPLIVLLFIWFLIIVREKNYILKEPESILIKKPFFSFATIIVLLVLLSLTLTHLR